MSFLRKLFGWRPPQAQSKQVAKERLKLALTYDRRGLASGNLEQLRREISRIIAKHFAVSEQDIQISFDRTAEYDKLIASIPQGPPRPPATAAPQPAAARRRRR
ncbi:MAG: hypothetical protein KatS3mg131_0049 [Candidatus Tectimicrobiota bacterium]|nr:MAG: hypothetical protein KatS3mg131_0049 [Candidatus Tectomicrobia bacterium]